MAKLGILLFAGILVLLAKVRWHSSRNFSRPRCPLHSFMCRFRKCLHRSNGAVGIVSTYEMKEYNRHGALITTAHTTTYKNSSFLKHLQ